MTRGSLRHAFDFWKPLVERSELDGLVHVASPGQRVPHSVSIWSCDDEPRQYRITEGAARYALFASVCPIAEVPESAEPLAEVTDLAGNHHSYVLWFAEESCAVVPFDPDEAIEAMWFERHVPEAKRTVLPMPVLTAYYKLKPMIPGWLKRFLRGVLARKTEDAETFLSWPSDTSLDQLMRLLLRLTMLAGGRERLPFVWFWPDGHPWAAVLTHDVETAGGFENIEHVMDLELQRGLHSSFNLVSLDYEVDEERLDRARGRGFEFGVHGYTHDGLMFSSWKTFTERVETVNERAKRWSAVGFRSPATYRNLEWFHRLEFEYDSSVTDSAPFEPQPGGCASHYPYFVGELVELPMTLPQDHTLYSLLGQTDTQVWLTKLDEIRQANAMACVLTHPDPATGYIGRPENEARYLEVLDHIAASEAWTPLPRELVRWWRTRAGAGSSAEQKPTGASVGYAVLDGRGRLRLDAPAGGPSA